MRLDKYLKVSRLIKRRTVANEACDAGRVMINEKVAKASTDVKVGDVISFFDPAGNGTSIVTHRVIEIVEEDGEILFRTRGDNNNTEDKELVPAENLVGIYKMRI